MEPDYLHLLENNEKIERYLQFLISAEEDRTDKIPKVYGFVQACQVYHGEAKAKGWWETVRKPSELFMLIVTEIAEATEAVRAKQPPIFFESGEEKFLPAGHETFEELVEKARTMKPEGELIELADAAIRMYDFLGWIFSTSQTGGIEEMVSLQAEKTEIDPGYVYITERVQVEDFSLQNRQDLSPLTRHFRMVERLCGGMPLLEDVNPRAVETLRHGTVDAHEIMFRRQCVVLAMVETLGDIHAYFQDHSTWTLAEIATLKAIYNRTRSYRHGGKAF